ncbi:MAG: hypothetical protein KF886_05030 [Candidatus Hydrogenedentes bacterium]|nr:hypothetical protein [Candidatus Hydrogenedentota bacterium]
MLYRLTAETLADNPLRFDGDGRRFVLHRHRDGDGAHLDLRLEQDGYLMGYRIEGATLGPESWATAKAPHPLHWLDQDGEAVREDGGTYFWERGDPSTGVLVLCGARETVRVRVEPVGGLSAGVIAGIRAAAEALGASLGEIPALARDGATARARAIARFCGLGRELDGDAFDAALWRRTLAGEPLGVIQQYLHTLEVRFDRKYPPRAVSIPAPLGDWEARGDVGRAMGILKGEG